MANCSCVNDIEKYGANPVNVQWKIVRGDTATLTIDFLEVDETTSFDTSDWTYKATAYDPQGNVLDNLEVTATTGSVTITADCTTTERWGTNLIARSRIGSDDDLDTVGGDSRFADLDRVHEAAGETEVDLLILTHAL